MKIAIDCRLIGQSGIGTYIENIVRHAVLMPDYEFVLIGSSKRLSRYCKQGNCRIVECTHKSFSFRELFKFPTKEVNRCDVFFAPNFNIPLGIKVPVFCTVHDVVFFDVEGICSPIGKAIRWAYIKRALSISKAVFTVSNFSKSRIGELFHPACPILVSYCGISEELKQYKRTHAPAAERKDNLVFLGNLKKHKGLHTLIAAFDTLLQNPGVKTTLTVIGNIDFRTKDSCIQHLLSRKSDRIIYLRGASNEQVYKELSEAKALVSPSVYEGFGLPPIEAMYLGTPAVISDIPVYREVYGDSPAIFFKAGDADDLARRIADIPSAATNIGNYVEKKYDFSQITAFIINHINNYFNQNHSR